MSQPLLIAHRGASAQHRENAPAAWQAAIAAGAAMIEADVRMSADHRIVICHDADLARIAGSPDVIAETPFAELQRHSAEDAPAAPPLSQLFATVPPRQPILFDVKDERPVALALLVEAALASGRENLTFGLHRVEGLRRLRRIAELQVKRLIEPVKGVAAARVRGAGPLPGPRAAARRTADAG